jgi:hypothetical protein
MTGIASLSIDPYRRGAGTEPSREAASFGFADLLDVVNPLQHIPGVNLLYRELTGDTIKPPAAIAGGALFGGPLGFAGAFLAAAFEEVTGETPLQRFADMADATGRTRAAAAYAQTAALAKDEIRR